MGSVATRDPALLPRFDVVVAGFPCQPFSRLGRQQGVFDPGGRGVLVDHTLAYIRHHRPRIVVLENVAAFCTMHDGATMAWIVSELKKCGYYVEHRVVCTSRFGLPQTRRRWYLIAVLSSALVQELVWPAEIDQIPLCSLLGPRPAGASPARRPGPAGGLASRNVSREVGRLVCAGVDVASAGVLDCDASASWSGQSKACCPCLTRSRRKGFWHIGRGERLSPHACMRLQGLRSDQFGRACSDGDLRALAGNSMSL